MKQLIHLNIKTNHIETKGAISLSRKLSKVSFWRVGNNRVGDYGTSIICENCTNLTSLGLWDNNLTSSSLETILKLRKLTWLTLSNNSLNENDIILLCHSLKSLRFFDISKI